MYIAPSHGTLVQSLIRKTFVSVRLKSWGIIPTTLSLKVEPSTSSAMWAGMELRGYIVIDYARAYPINMTFDRSYRRIVGPGLKEWWTVHLFCLFSDLHMVVSCMH